MDKMVYFFIQKKVKSYLNLREKYVNFQQEKLAYLLKNQYIYIRIKIKNNKRDEQKN